MCGLGTYWEVWFECDCPQSVTLKQGVVFVQVPFSASVSIAGYCESCAASACVSHLRHALKATPPHVGDLLDVMFVGRHVCLPCVLFRLHRQALCSRALSIALSVW